MSLHWLPNAITVLRIALVAPVVWLIAEQQYAPALILFFIAGLSDGLDGFLARRFAWHSRTGALLDPLADKLLMTGCYAVLWFVGLLPGWLSALVIVRDTVIVGGATAYNFLIKPVDASPTRISKFNTALELLLVLSVLGGAAYGWPPQAMVIVAGAAVFVTIVISGIDYVWAWSIKAKADK